MMSFDSYVQARAGAILGLAILGLIVGLCGVDNTLDPTFFWSFGLVALVALGCFVVWSENAVKRGIGRAKLLVDNKADVKAKDQVNLRVISLTHTSSMFPRCCRIAGTPLCR